MKADKLTKLEREAEVRLQDVVGVALEAGFSIGTMCGKQKLIPCSDIETLVKFSQLLLELVAARKKARRKA